MTGPSRSSSKGRRRWSWRPAAAALGMLLVIVACAGSGQSSVDGPSGTPGTSGSPLPSSDPSPSMGADASMDAGARLCEVVDSVVDRLGGFQGIELRRPNKVALDIELGKLQAAFVELRQADLGELEERLEDPLRRLGYRLDELELAVEDFRTSPRIRRAIPHVEEDTGVFADALAGFAILSRC